MFMVLHLHNFYNTLFMVLNRIMVQTPLLHGLLKIQVLLLQFFKKFIIYVFIFPLFVLYK